MSTHSHTLVQADLVGPAEDAKTDRLSAAHRSQEEVYAEAEQRMRRGRRLVIGGFVVAVVGVIGYSVACFSAAVSPQLGSTLLERPGWLVGPALGIIGLGTLLWLVGSFMYLTGAMDSDPNGPDLYF